MLLPIQCHGCSHRFQRTAAAVLADDRCPRCASVDLDVDDAGWATVAAVSRTGTPSPKIKVTWTENDSWRPGDPPRDPDYADRYFTYRLDHTNGAPEPVNVIEAMIHDHTAYGKADFRWEVDATSQWGGDFGEHGDTTSLDQAKAQAAAAIQRASDQFWSEYDDTPTPKGTPGGFPWDRRSSKQASSDGCPECGHALQWGRHPGEAGKFGEELGFCPYCEWKGTEDDLKAEASVSKVARIATAIKDSNPEVPYHSAVELAREAVRRFPSVVSS